MSANIQPAPFTCPACSLLCDDITPSNNTCAKSVAFFAQPLVDASAKMKGKTVSAKEAISHVAALLKNSKSPVFSGLSTDIAGFKAIDNLAQKIGGELQHINAKSMARNLKVLQSSGWQTTTLTEVKNRADFILCIGSDIVSHHPRFFERFVHAEGMFAGGKNRPRKVCFLGENNPHVKSDALKAASHLACGHADLPSVLAALHALVLGKALKARQVAGISLTELQALADELKAAKYAVLTWVAKDLDFNHAELAIEQITQIVATLNQTTRAAGLPLGGSDGDTSANYAHTWRTGRTLAELEQAKPDLQIWINSYNFDAPPAFCHTPTVVLGNVNTAWGEHADVFIPVATPGLDCAGTLFRVDGSVILPLKKAREANNQNYSLPTLAEIVCQIENALQ